MSSAPKKEVDENIHLTLDLEGEDENIQEMLGGDSWTRSYQKTWENITEDTFGRIILSNKEEQQKRIDSICKNQSEMQVQKGMLRYLYIILDCSQRMVQSKDLKPNRLVLSLKMMESFIREYFDQNPLSHLGIIVAHNKKAVKLTNLGGNPLQQISKIHSLNSNDFPEDGGLFSLQNSLELAKKSLMQIPIHGSREILLITGSLSTVDPDDIFYTIKSLKQYKISVHILSLSAELNILKMVSEATNGDFNVILDEQHFKECLLAKVPPQPIEAQQNHLTNRKWIPMGFPKHEVSKFFPSLCVCHEDNFTYDGFHCPRCNAKVCEVPTDCNICGLSLISAPHLVRSYHHLFPVKKFKSNLNINENEHKYESILCYGCAQMIDTQHELVEQCDRCKQVFCIECNAFIHESLHNCPGCMSQVQKV
ncbi:hypothetical protein RFI_22861 [Reticulomyxa filosa]|uniref:General transcription factor IIH subunit n=1 Tax=Reticulomyxa filosa TaxID=46433 RepID=X6MLI4_RETFI|nr:hypothetical protein RFI_22861 [Reticulomyxa filosa]|eukprot:ETO14501.1 hypothetical protein RFI_22861 [Reticulomyxa filosa]